MKQRKLNKKNLEAFYLTKFEEDQKAHFLEMVDPVWAKSRGGSILDVGGGGAIRLGNQG